MDKKPPEKEVLEKLKGDFRKNSSKRLPAGISAVVWCGSKIITIMKVTIFPAKHLNIILEKKSKILLVTAAFTGIPMLNSKRQSVVK